MVFRKGFVSNSSSTSFVCEPTIGLDEVEETLKLMLVFYNQLFGSNLTFEGVFEKPFIASEQYSRCMADVWQYKCPVGSLIIGSVNDNSIPYALFEIIAQKFNGYSNHLG